MRAISATLVIALGAAAAPAALPAQDPPAPQYRQVLSANPFGLLLEFFNAEYERRVSDTATMGVGGSTIVSSDEQYVNADVFYRYYPGARAPEGWAFGAKLGLTHVPDSGTYPGIGFDVNHSWLLGKNQNFYVGLGFGLKRLLGVKEDDFVDDILEFIPTLRIVNVGFAF